MNTEEAIRCMKRDLIRRVNDIVFAELSNTISDLKEQVWNRYSLIDHALDRNHRFCISDGHVNCKRYRYMDYCYVRQKLYAKAEILSWFISVLCQLDK